LQPDSDGEGSDGPVARNRSQAVDDVWRNLDEVAGTDLALFAAHRHDAAAVEDVVEFERVVAVRIDGATGLHLELADQFEIAAYRILLHLARLIKPPDRDAPVVLEDGLDVLDRSYVHFRQLLRLMTASRASRIAVKSSSIHRRQPWPERSGGGPA